MEYLINKFLMNFYKITESDSNYDILEKKSIKQLLEIINSEDQTVAFSVKKEISKINTLITKVIKQLKSVQTKAQKVPTILSNKSK